MTMLKEVKPGDYFYTSWGYDQTNIDYCVVAEISPTGKTALCQMVNPIHVGSEGCEDVLMPGTAYGPTFRMRIKQVCGQTCLSGSYPYIANIPDAKRSDLFFLTKLTTHRQTRPEFGH